MLKGKKYIICDMDGTLIQSLGVWDSVDTALIEALGGGPELVRAVGPAGKSSFGSCGRRPIPTRPTAGSWGSSAARRWRRRTFWPSVTGLQSTSSPAR